MTGPVTGPLRALLAEVGGQPDLALLPGDAPLLGPAGSLGSLSGTLLLRRIKADFGVDVAAEDLNLDALATLDTLAAFIEAHR
jgi:hypothetical protein